MCRTALAVIISLLTVSLFCQAPTNVTCEDAEEIFCDELVSGTTDGIDFDFVSNDCFFIFGDIVWYKLIGDGSVNVITLVGSNSLEFSIISGSCSDESSMNCRGEYFLFGEFESFKIQSEPGEELFIAVENGCCEASFEFIFNCEEATNYDLCSNAKPINCQDFIEVSLANASSEQYSNLCSPENEPDLWLTLEGDDMIHVLESVNHIDQNFEIDVYEGSCEDRFDNCPLVSLEFDFSDSTNTFLAEAGTNYQLRISSRFTDADTIQLNHFCMLPSSNDLCENAEIIDCGEPLVGNTLFATSSNQFNGCSFEDSNDVWFSIIGDDMVHEFSPDSIQNFIFIEIYEEDCGLEYTLCREPIFLNTTESSSFFTESGKTYNIRVYGNSGFFELNHSCRLPLVNDNCTNAIQISCGQTVEGNTNLATSTGLFNGCTEEFGKDLWFKVEGNGQIYNLTADIFEQSEINIEIYEEECSSIYTICNDQLFLPQGESDFFFAAEGTTYYLRLTNFPFNEDAFFRFNIDCLEPIANDNCTDAIDISCGDIIEGNTELATSSNSFNGCTFEDSPDLWYTIDGDDLNYLITVNSLDIEGLAIDIYQESCDASFTICRQRFFLEEDGFDVFLAQAGITYYLRVYRGDSYGEFESESFELSIECVEPPTNDNCENPETLICGQTFESDFFFANAESNQFPCSFYGQEDDVWYEIIGDDMVHKFQVDVIDFSSLQIEIIEGTCDVNNGECFESTSLNQSNPYSFFAETGKNYLIRLYKNCCYGSTGTFFRLNHECVALAENDSCDSAFLWECGSAIIGSTSLATFTEGFDGCNPDNSPDLWYIIEGDDLVHSISVLNSDVDNEIIIYQQSCNGDFTNCEISFNTFNGGGGFNFFAESSQNYLVQIIMANCCSTSNEFNFMQECFTPIANDFCENAIDISCGVNIDLEISSATPSLTEFCFSGENENDVWFKLDGDDLIHVFESNDENVEIRIEIYDTDCGIDQYNCPIFGLNTLRNTNSFPSEIGTSYLIRMYSEDRNVDISLNHICLEPAANGMCLTAEQMTCGETIIGNTQAAPRTSYSCNSISLADRALWYEFVGDGKIHQFQFGPEVVDPLDLILIEGECDDQFNANCQRLFINSEFSILFEENVIYYLRIAFSRDDGSFTLFHNCIEPAANNSCETAMPISCNDVLTGDTNIATGDPNMEACTNSSSSDLWYSIEGDGMIHNFSFGSSESNCISVGIYESCTEEIENCLSLLLREENDNLRFLADVGTTYLVRVTTCFNQQGTFELEYSCTDVSPNDLCENAIEITCGETLVGDTRFASHSNEFNGCNFEDTNDVWYTITGDNKTHAFSSQSNSFNLSLDLYEGSCPMSFIECRNDIFINDSQSFTFFAEVGIIYTIRVYYNSFTDSGPFSINYECEDPPVNDDCTNAIEIDCNTSQINGDLTFANSREQIGLCNNNNQFKDIWYSITGDGLLHAFFYLDGDASVIEIYENFCDEDNFTCTDQSFGLAQGQEPGRFIAELNKTYLLRVHNGLGPTNNFSFLHMCMEQTENDNCENAIAINCGESFSGDFTFSTSEGRINGCFNDDGNDLWYTIEGDDQVHFFTLVESENSFLAIEIFRNDCSFPRECLISESITDGRTEDFFLEEGTDYLIRISKSTFRSDISFEFEHDCFPIADNDECENAIPITCGDIIEGNTKEATINEETNFCRIGQGPDLWYSIIGDGQIHTFEFNNLESDVFRTSVFEENCDTTVCLISESLNRSSTLTTFQTLPNINYLINIGAECCGPAGTFTFEYTCNPAVANDACENAISINCAEPLEGSLQNSTSTEFRSNCLSETQNDVWFTLTGDGNAHIFSQSDSQFNTVFLQIFETSCPDRFEACPMNLISLNDDDNSEFFIADEGIDYLIRVFGANNLTTFAYAHRCEEPESDGILSLIPQNDNCIDAIEFRCGETFNVNVINAEPDPEHRNCGYTSAILNESGLWYRFTGDGSLWELNTLSTENPPYVFVYEGDCSNTTCLQSDYNFFSDRIITIDSQDGVNYYVLVRSSRINENEIIIDVNCIDPPSNDLCENATEVVCGEEYIVGLGGTTSSDQFNGCIFENNNDVWFSYTGNGEVLAFDAIVESFQDRRLDIYEGGCLNITSCALTFFINTSTSNSFFAALGVDYLIRLSTTEDNPESVRLTFDCLPVSANDLCINAEEITCDSLIQGNLMAASPSDANACIFQTRNDLWYTLIGDGLAHTFSPGSSGDLIMEFYEDFCTDDPVDCPESIQIDFSNTQNTFITEQGVTYYIRLFDPNFSNVSRFTINHRCGEIIPNDECTGAMPISCQDTIIQEITFSTTSLIENSDCQNIRKDVWFTFEGTDQYLQVDLLFFSFSRQFHRIFTGNCESDLECLNDFILDDDQDSYLFFAEAGITYHISASADDLFGNNILFTTTCLDPSKNDECVDALALNCGEVISGNTATATAQPIFTGCDFDAENDLWYVISGDDLYHSFEYISSDAFAFTINIYEGTCDTYFNNCVTDFRISEPRPTNSFFAESGTDYLIEITPDDPGNFSFIYNCLEPAINDLCEQAITINCEETVQVNLLNSSYSPLYSDCQMIRNTDIWYQIIGDDQIKTLSIDSLFDANTVIEIYTQECTNKYNCIDQFEFRGDELNQGFFAEEGLTYFLRIYPRINTFLPSFNISLQCDDVPTNITCANAISINCGDQLTASSIGLQPSDDIDPCFSGFQDAPVIWYTLTGNNQIQTLTIESTDVIPYASIYNGDCSALDCAAITSFSQSNFSRILSLSFKAERDSIYYLMVSSSLTDSPGEFSISVNCEPIPENDFLEGAQFTTCGDNIQGTIVNATISELIGACDGEAPSAAGVWYSYESFGDSLEIIFNELGFVPTISLFEVIDGTMICVEQQTVSPSINSINTCASSTIPSFEIPCMIADLDSICVPIFVDNMEDIIELNFDVSYDTSLFRWINTNINYFGGIGTRPDFENQLLTIRWDSNNERPIIIDESIPYFIELCFATNPDQSPDQLELNFVGDPFVLIQLENGFRVTTEGCFDSGIVYQTGTDIQCDEEISALFSTNPDTEYFIHISGSNEFDSGGFDFTMNCQEEIIVQEIPTMGEWGLIILTLLMLIFGVVSIKSGVVVDRREVS